MSGGNRMKISYKKKEGWIDYMDEDTGTITVRIKTEEQQKLQLCWMKAEELYNLD